MMKTSNSSSRFSKGPTALFAGAVISLKFFGPVPALLEADNPWTGFRDDAPVLVMIRAEKIPLGGASASSCAAWVNALGADRFGQPLATPSEKNWAMAVKAWEPWKSEDTQDVEKCAKLPCNIKLNGPETAQMAAVPPTARREKFLALVRARAEQYLKTGERKEYEFKGDPVEPWKWMEEMGLKAPLPIPLKPALSVRRIDFFPGKVKTLHQILDTRITTAPDRQEATLWRRDVYTDHYFDSWGEWVNVSCAGHESVTVIQALLVELDLMKKTDLISKLGRSQMRGAVEDNGLLYLAQGFDRLKRRATKGGLPTDSASGSSK